MVSKANAVVDPRAVMVKSLYAVLADGAVPTPASPDSLTVRAQLAGINVVEQLAKVYILVFQVAWL